MSKSKLQMCQISKQVFYFFPINLLIDLAKKYAEKANKNEKIESRSGENTLIIMSTDV